MKFFLILFFLILFFLILLYSFLLCLFLVLRQLRAWRIEKEMTPTDEYADQLLRLSNRVRKVGTRYQFIAADNALCQFWYKYKGKIHREALVRDYETLTTLLDKKHDYLSSYYTVKPKEGFLPQVTLQFN